MEDEIIEAADGAEEHPTGADGVDGGEGEHAAPDEPFLRVNERTVFKDREAALRAFEERESLIGNYRKLGDPSALQGQIERLRLLEKLVAGDKADDGAPKSSWTKEQVEANRAYVRELQRAGILKEIGLMTREELDADRAETEKQRGQELAASANEEGSNWLQKHGIELSKEEAEEALTLGGHMISTNEKLNRMYFVEGKVAEVVDHCLSRIFRAEIKSKEAASAGADKGAAIAARAKAAVVQSGTDKIRKLPSPPPKSGGAAAAGQKPLDLKDAKVRRQQIEEILDREGALA